MTRITILFFCFFITCLSYAEAKDSTQQSVLWEISGHGLEKPSYVFAKWHLLCRNEIIFKHKVKLAIHATQQLLIQNHMHYLTDEDYYARQNTLEKLDTGEKIYKIKDRKKRKTLLKLIKNNLDLNYDPVKRIKYLVKRMTPLNAFLLSAHSFIDGCQNLGSFDRQLFSHYKKNEFNIGALGTNTDFYQGWINSGAMTADSLTHYLTDFENRKALVRQMKQAYYIDENLDTLNQTYLQFLKNASTDADLINQHLLTADTQAWMPTIVHAMRSAPTFISINAAYIQGNHGVLNRLRTMGYKVEPVLQ